MKFNKLNERTMSKRTRVRPPVKTQKENTWKSKERQSVSKASKKQEEKSEEKRMKKQTSATTDEKSVRRTKKKKQKQQFSKDPPQQIGRRRKVKSQPPGLDRSRTMSWQQQKYSIQHQVEEWHPGTPCYKQESCLQQTPCSGGAATCCS